MRSEKRQILAQLVALRDARPRHFWSGVALASLSFSLMVTAFAVAPHTPVEPFDQTTVVEAITLDGVSIRPGTGAFVSQTQILRGDTVGTLFSRLGIDDPLVLRELRGIAEARDLFRQMRPGKTVTAHTSPEGHLLSLLFPLNGGDRVLRLQRQGENLEASASPATSEAHVVVRSGEIRSSLFAATDAADIPDSVAAQLADIFGGHIDFYRDLRQGDRFAVVYEVLNGDGFAGRAGRVLAAEFINQGITLRAFLFGDPSSPGAAYYDEQGRSLRKAFLRSPLEFSRVSSGFAMRKHPILGRMRAHKGVDYAAPTGTRVRAAGDGVVVSVGRQNGYGNTVVLRHRGQVTTHYAHLNRFANGLRPGARVAQGEVIGYVGMTGLATGPHLHYEFRVGDIHKNPLTVAMPEAPPLDSRLKAAFREGTRPLTLQLTLAAASGQSTVE